MSSDVLERLKELKAPEINLGRIKFYGQPEGFEKKALSDTISFLKNETEVDERIKDKIEKIQRIKGSFTIFVSPYCSHCLDFVRKMIQVAVLNPNVQLYVIDITQFEELRRELEIVATPTFFVNGKLRLHGDIELDEVLEIVERLDDREFLYNFTLKAIREGRVEDLVYTLKNIDSKNIVKRLLKEDDLFVRLGTMYLLELVGEKGGTDLGKELIEMLSEVDGRTKEDVIMAISKVGGEEELKILRDLFEKSKRDDEVEGDELEEAIDEAIKEMKGRLKRWQT